MDRAHNQKYDLTEGSILGKLLMVALPIIGTQLIQMSYNLTDMFLLGRVGSHAVAAAGSAGMFVWLSNGLMLVGRMGAEIGVAQNMGRRDIDSARRFSHDSMFLGALIGLTFGLICLFFSDVLIGIFRIREKELAEDAARYLSIVACAMPFSFISSAIVGAFNGSGNSRLPFYINMTGLLTNIVLDPIFIFLLGLGVTGAAVATVIAQIIVFFLMLLALIYREDRPFETYKFRYVPKLNYILQILRWTVPISVENVLFSAFTIYISRFVAAFGAGAIAIFRVGSQIESLCWLVCVGFSAALTAFVGQNFGAGRIDRIKTCSRVAFASISAWGLIVTLIMLFGGPVLYRFFLPDPQLIEMGDMFLKIMSICQIPGCLEAASAGSFRGLGRTVPPSLVSVLVNAARVPFTYLLSISALGLNGIWLGMTIGASVRGLWLAAWFYRELKGNRLKLSFE